MRLAMKSHSRLTSILFTLSLFLSLGTVASATINSPIKIIVPYAPGGPTDIISRIIGEGLSEELDVNVIIENKPGASGTIGAGMVARATPNGQTLLVNSSIHEVLPSISSELPYDTATAFTPLA